MRVVRACAAFAAAIAHAQSGTPADAAARGVAEQQRASERERAQRQQLQRAPEATTQAAPSQAAEWPEAESPCMPIRDIALDGEQADHFSDLLASLHSGPDAAIGRCLGAVGLDVAAAHAQQAAMRQGYVTTRILLQPQDLSGGRLTLTVVPGRIRAIRFADGTPPRGTAINAVPAKPGDILNLRDIEQALENFKRVPTASADIRIEPADIPGESDLLISWQQTFPFRLTTTLDDSGAKSTGKYQGSVTVSYDHWWTLNDLFYATLSHDLGGGATGSRGTRGHTLHYSVPWGYWLLGMNSTESRYHQSVAGLNQDYLYRGTSRNADLKLSRLVYRDTVRKTTLSLKGWLKRSTNFIDDTELQPQRRATGGWELGTTHKESIGGATLEFSLTHRRGTAAFNATPAPEDPLEGTARMRVTNADVTVSAPFRIAEQNLRYQGTFRGQWNGTPLTPQDRFAIGGRYTVRGFDGESSLSAERGWLVRNDLGLALGDSGQEAYAGIDYGQVRGPASGWLLGKHLAGLAAGLRGNIRNVSYDLFVGRPLSRPAYFRTAPVVAGFSLTATF